MPPFVNNTHGIAANIKVPTQSMVCVATHVVRIALLKKAKTAVRSPEGIHMVVSADRRRRFSIVQIGQDSSRAI